MRTPRRAALTALTLHECKIRASLLLKDLRGEDQPRAARAAERFPILPAFAALETEAIFQRRDSIQLKHALAVIAAELGYPAWKDCKRRLEVPAEQRLDTEKFFGAGSAAYLNRWFAALRRGPRIAGGRGRLPLPVPPPVLHLRGGVSGSAGSTRPTRTGNGSDATGCVLVMKGRATASSACWSPWVTGDRHRMCPQEIRRGTPAVRGAVRHRSPQGC